MKLADPSFELRWADTGEPVSENPTFYHLSVAHDQARYLERTCGRNVTIRRFCGWQQLAEDWKASR